jgi:hypothetical protein
MVRLVSWQILVRSAGLINWHAAVVRRFMTHFYRGHLGQPKYRETEAELRAFALNSMAVSLNCRARRVALVQVCLTIRRNQQAVATVFYAATPD